MVGEMFNISILKWSKLLLESPPRLEKFSKITTLKWLKLLLNCPPLLSFSFLFFFYPPPVGKTLITVGKKNPNISTFYQYILKIWGFCSTFRSTFPISVQEVHISTVATLIEMFSHKYSVWSPILMRINVVKFHFLWLASQLITLLQ